MMIVEDNCVVVIGNDSNPSLYELRYISKRVFIQNFLIGIKDPLFIKRHKELNRWSRQNHIPVLLKLAANDDLRLQFTSRVFQLPVATKRLDSRFIYTRTHIRASQNRQQIRSFLPQLAFTKIATIDQQVRAFAQCFRDRLQFVGVLSLHGLNIQNA